MSDTLVLRKVYVIDSNTGIYMSTPGQVLVTDDKGGSTWTTIMSSLRIYGGPIVGNLPSTLSNISTLIWASESNISTLSNQNPGQITANNLTSTVTGLGSASYVSSLSLASTTSNILSTTFVTLGSTIEGLGSLGYISTTLNPEIGSTIVGLGTFGYISTSGLTSSLNGLGQIGYISTGGLVSTVAGLGNSYLSTANLQSTVAGLGKSGYVSTTGLTSTVAGLGRAGYVSTASLVSTTIALSTIQSRITFTNISNCYVRDSYVFVSSATNLIFLSSFYYSSLNAVPVGTASYGTTYNGVIENTSNFSFSTVTFDISPFSNYIVSSSRVSLEVYPTYLFNRLDPSAVAPAVLPISTILQLGTTIFRNTTTTSYMYAQTQNISLVTNPSLPGSNLFNQVIRVQIPPSSLVGNLTSTVTLFHNIPGGIANGAYTNALGNSQYSFYFGKPAAYLTVENSQQY